MSVFVVFVAQQPLNRRSSCTGTGTGAFLLMIKTQKADYGTHNQTQRENDGAIQKSVSIAASKLVLDGRKKRTGNYGDGTGEDQRQSKQETMGQIKSQTLAGDKVIKGERVQDEA